MKQSSLVLILSTLFLFLLYSRSGSARFLATKQDEQSVRDHWMTRTASWKEEDVLVQQMGLEECNDEKDEEECLNRRMAAEAHLDYIYTQHQKP